MQALIFIKERRFLSDVYLIYLFIYHTACSPKDMAYNKKHREKQEQKEEQKQKHEHLRSTTHVPIIPPTKFHYIVFLLGDALPLCFLPSIFAINLREPFLELFLPFPFPSRISVPY
jgi:hypothetical protein